MKKIINSILTILLFIIPLSYIHAFSGSEVGITKDGIITASDVKVMQIFGSTMAVRLYWGEAFIRLTVKTNTTTKFFRGTGEPTTMKEISEGDYLNVQGTLESGSGTLNIIASTIKNSSVQKKQTTFSGKVVSIDLTLKKFILDTKSTGVITVSATSTTQFKKGNRILDLAHIKVGDTITKTSGDYDLNTKTLVAQSVVTYVNMSYYAPKNFEGKLQEVFGSYIQVLINGTSFVVNFTDKTSILNRNRSAVLLSRFVPGDTIRIYGAIRETDDPIIDNVEIIRNTSL